MLLKRNRLCVVAFTCAFLAAIFYCGRYSVYLLESKAEPVRQTSFWLIDNFLGWERQEMSDLPAVTYLLGRYSHRKSDEPEISQFLMKSACLLVDRGTTDASESFFNAVFDQDMDVVSFWLYREVKLESLRIASAHLSTPITVDAVLEKISKDSRKKQLFHILVDYKKHGRLPVEHIDPCKKLNKQPP